MKPTVAAPNKSNTTKPTTSPPHHCWQNQRRDSRPKSILDIRGAKSKAYVEPEIDTIAADPVMQYMNKDQIQN